MPTVDPDYWTRNYDWSDSVATIRLPDDYALNTATHPQVTWSAYGHPVVVIGEDAEGPYLSITVSTIGIDGKHYKSLRLSPSGAESAALLRGILQSRDGLYAAADWLQDRNGPGAVTPECRAALWHTLRTLESLCQPVANALCPPLPVVPIDDADQYEPVAEPGKDWLGK